MIKIRSSFDLDKEKWKAYMINAEQKEKEKKSCFDFPRDPQSPGNDFPFGPITETFLRLRGINLTHIFWAPAMCQAWIKVLKIQQLTQQPKLYPAVELLAVEKECNQGRQRARGRSGTFVMSIKKASMTRWPEGKPRRDERGSPAEAPDIILGGWKSKMWRLEMGTCQVSKE